MVGECAIAMERYKSGATTHGSYTTLLGRTTFRHLLPSGRRACSSLALSVLVNPDHVVPTFSCDPGIIPNFDPNHALYYNPVVFLVSSIPISLPVTVPTNGQTFAAEGNLIPDARYWVKLSEYVKHARRTNRRTSCLLLKLLRFLRLRRGTPKHLPLMIMGDVFVELARGGCHISSGLCNWSDLSIQTRIINGRMWPESRNVQSAGVQNVAMEILGYLITLAFLRCRREEDHSDFALEHRPSENVWDGAYDKLMAGNKDISAYCYIVPAKRTNTRCTRP
ncbi:hypothetical protein EVAR_89908_1 [Eumeta japonica]|uniref:Uncharacterized protein n=1 Tax=Eumeta variegata TaxID=151549 RepID=A0A4C2AA19_EUMVA|nr:hypothetical protein EVAR_89908_1 [Eumeta japonica]